jgi:hypothetical protein
MTRKFVPILGSFDARFDDGNLRGGILLLQSGGCANDGNGRQVAIPHEEVLGEF